MTRAGKGSTYEGGHRVPGIVWAPNRIGPGKCGELIVGMDIMPTSLAMANLVPRKKHRFDGIDVGTAIFEKKNLTERPVIWGKNSSGALRRGPWKLVKNELYNLYDDPRERKDVALNYPDRVKQMIKERSVIFEEAIGDSPYDNRINK